MKNKAKKLPAHLERLKRSGAGMASATHGRSRVFKDRKKESARRACRGKVSQ